MRFTLTGSLPGTDFRGSVKYLLDTYDELAWPELPSRGLTAGMLGRSVGLLDGLAVGLERHSWRLTDHETKAQRRARAWWRQDLDDLEELLQDFCGTLKVGICGPLTLAANLGRHLGEVALTDHGALRDIGQSLHSGWLELQGELVRRLPEVTIQLQLDEPMLPMILGGELPSASGYRRLDAIEPHVAITHLKPFAPGTILHCCAAGDYFEVIAQAGFSGWYQDLHHPSTKQIDESAAWLDQGKLLIAGVVDTTAQQSPGVDAIVDHSLRLLEQLSAPSLDQVVLAPACGLGLWQTQPAAKLIQDLAKAVPLVVERWLR